MNANTLGTVTFINTNLFIFISVASLPDKGYGYNGARALTSLSGNGVYLQDRHNFYELNCNSTSCNWSIMEQKLTRSTFPDIMSYLPPDYDC